MSVDKDEARAAHADYYLHSPYYRSLIARYGKKCTQEVASAIAADHSTTTHELAKEVDFYESDKRTVNIALLLAALGY